MQLGIDLDALRTIRDRRLIPAFQVLLDRADRDRRLVFIKVAIVLVALSAKAVETWRWHTAFERVL